VHYLVATTAAVEAVILHNFAWHQRWTWKDRVSRRRLDVLTRLVKFNLLNGGISLAGNAAVMALLTGAAGVEPVVANAAAILLCSLANFFASETLVFRSLTPADRIARG
jgi:putative flippase GtrA